MLSYYRFSSVWSDIVTIVVFGSVIAAITSTIGVECGLTKLNEIQLKGSRHSYHTAPWQAIPPWDYNRLSFPKQLAEQNISALHLVFRQVGQSLPVYRKALVDQNTLCYNVSQCLLHAKTWSDMNRNHLPLFFILEQDPPDASTTWGWDGFDYVLTSIFPPDRIVTPDFVRGARATVYEAIQKDGWPALSQCLGKAVFLLKIDEKSYLIDHLNLQGRIGFPISEMASKTSESSMVFLVEDPISNRQKVEELVNKKALVITYTDETYLSPLVDVDAYNPTKMFLAADINQDREASREELVRLSLGLISDENAVYSMVDDALFSCAGAGNTSASSSEMKCIVDNMRASLPSIETLFQALSRSKVARDSGAHVLLTMNPGAPFPGAPARQNYWFAFNSTCNPLTTCTCSMAELTSVPDNEESEPCPITGSSPHINPQFCMLAAVFLAASLMTD
ncbi:Phosphoinositide phospholipase C, Ca2+-dependent [Pelomyxa schiedti]|nr:Phosphoinositide phospholipase C, Ca2+-dependent [Pelomyxa schiedti]